MSQSLLIPVAILILAPGVHSLLVADEVDEAAITDEDREHWSFQPLTRPRIPKVENTAWPRNPIDRFVLGRLEAKGIAPQPPADRTTLIRRVTIDLAGLPPTPAEIDAFVADDSPNAYERLVDRLLASPAFGERMAKPWLDLARWAQTDGFEHDKDRPGAWKYRDWVIDAFNRDLPYDQFVALQLAGDELRPGDPWAQAATGFCLAGPDMPDINLQEERRDTVLNDITSTVGSVFLGLQFGCAQCHDHKFDPISQADFFRLRAIFEPAVDFSGHVFREGKPKNTPSYLYLRGDFRRRGPEVQPAFPRVVNVWEDKIELLDTDAKSTRRRAQLAAWLTRSNHPLTSRVIVNRLWQIHFGRGLSETPSDFGFIGDEPIHKELLDWLANELVESGWSTKHIHRLIVTSSTYRQASRPMSSDDSTWHAAVEGDAKNLLWSRYPRRRLTGETLRDMMLSVSDSLDRAQHGEGVRPPLPKEVVQTLLRPDHWKVSPSEADHYRRSVYVFARRNLRYPIFEAFDRPAATASCPRRDASTIAPQSLMLLNSEFSLLAARRLADSVKSSAGENRDEQINLVFRRTLGRLPTEEERSDVDAFFAKRQADDEALVDFCLAMLNTSEFVYLE